MLRQRHSRGASEEFLEDRAAEMIKTADKVVVTRTAGDFGLHGVCERRETENIRGYACGVGRSVAASSEVSQVPMQPPRKDVLPSRRLPATKYADRRGESRRCHVSATPASKSRSWATKSRCQPAKALQH